MYTSRKYKYKIYVDTCKQIKPSIGGYSGRSLDRFRFKRSGEC